MQATLTRPLPLELTEPITLAASLETTLREAYDVGSRYNPATQVRENSEGIPQFLDCGGTSSNQESESEFNFVVIDVNVDVQIDDNDIL